MKPIYQKGQTTRVLGAPKDWDEAKGTCEGLPIIDAHSHMYSHWEMTFKERLKVLFGGKICLIVTGAGHPPVAIEVL
jgi:hypothetical protein